MFGRAGTMRTTQTAKPVYSDLTREEQLNFRPDKNKTQHTQASRLPFLGHALYFFLLFNSCVGRSDHKVASTVAFPFRLST